MSRRADRVVFTPATPADVEELIVNLRPADIDEVDATVGAQWRNAAIRIGAQSSRVAWTARLDGKLAMVFGANLRNMVYGEGAPWALGTAIMDESPRAVIALSPSYIVKMLAEFPHLVNFVDARNTRSIRWLRWLGFTIHDPEPFGLLGLPFHKFEMRA